MHGSCMATKTISLTIEAYERLRRAKGHAGESFSEVVMRAIWDDEPITAGEFLKRARARGPEYAPAELDYLDELKASDVPPEDKWMGG